MRAPQPGSSTGSGTGPRYWFATTSTSRKTSIVSATYFYSEPPRKPEFLMKILYCNKYNYPFSGTEIYLFELMELMRAQGHEVALFSMADPRGEPTPYDRHFVPHIEFKEQSGAMQKAWNAA